jgi:hypothetical protein
LILETGDPAFSGQPKQFKMELSSLTQEDFKEKVKRFGIIRSKGKTQSNVGTEKWEH